MSNITLKFSAPSSGVSTTATAKHDRGVLLWTVENIGGFPAQPLAREQKLESLSRVLCVKRIEVIERQADWASFESPYDPHREHSAESGGVICLM